MKTMGDNTLPTLQNVLKIVETIDPLAVVEAPNAQTMRRNLARALRTQQAIQWKPSTTEYMAKICLILEELDDISENNPNLRDQIKKITYLLSSIYLYKDK